MLLKEEPTPLPTVGASNDGDDVRSELSDDVEDNTGDVIKVAVVAVLDVSSPLLLLLLLLDDDGDDLLFDNTF